MVLVRIWGNWCGPNWTGGCAKPAKDYRWDLDPNPQTTDDLDMACKIHDRAYGDPTDKTTKKQADLDLQRKARKIFLKNPLSEKGLTAKVIEEAMRLKRWV